MAEICKKVVIAFALFKAFLPQLTLVNQSALHTKAAPTMIIDFAAFILVAEMPV